MGPKGAGSKVEVLDHGEDKLIRIIRPDGEIIGYLKRDGETELTRLELD